MEICLLISVLFSLLVTVIDGNCRFPDFLQKRLKDGAQRTWLTMTVYDHNSATWKTQQEITVHGGVITSVVKYRGTCADDETTPNCIKQKPVSQRRLCYRQITTEKFLVEYRDGDNDGEKLYSCMQFLKRNTNVVQVREGIQNMRVDAALCNEDELPKDKREREWPWIVPVQQEWSFCPIVGGFDFSSYHENEKKTMCENEWRPSKLESECISGEGLRFIFPQKSCSPFGADYERFIQCWADWQEGDYHFIVAGDAGKHNPRYTLRFPIERSNTFEAHLYFSAVAPLNRNGEPPGTGIKHAILTMRKSSSLICDDESEKCADFQRENKCSSHPTRHVYAIYCRRSCGLCAITRPSLKVECIFGIDMQNSAWVQFEDHQQINVSMRKGQIDFGRFGRFFCKAPHYSQKSHRYKTFSLHENGCRPRYSCVRIRHRQGGTVEYEILRSELTDIAIDVLCEVKKSDAIAREAFSEYHTKTLFPKSKLRTNQCGLNGMIDVTSLSKSGEKMVGTLTDYIREPCVLRAQLVLALNSTNGKRSIQKEAMCRASMQIRDGVKLLVTQDVQTDKYACWIVKKSRHGRAASEWHQIHILQTAHCGHEYKTTNILKRHPWMSLQMKHNATVQKVCEYNHVTKSEPPSPTPEVTVYSISKPTNENLAHLTSSGTRINWLMFPWIITLMSTVMWSHILNASDK